MAMLSRRKLLGWMLGIGIAAYAGKKAYQKVSRSIAETFLKDRPLTTQGFTLPEILHEADIYEIEKLGIPIKVHYFGFPTFVASRGYKFGKIADKNTMEQAIIFGEDHIASPEHIAPLLTHLVSNYGFDSIGFEGFFGGPNPGIKEARELAVREHLGETKIKGSPVTLHGIRGDTINAHIADMDLHTSIDSAFYKPLLKQASGVPAFGIEDKELYLTICAIQLYRNILANVLNLSQTRYHNHNIVERIPPSIHEQFEAILARTRERNSQLALPRFCLYDLAWAFDLNGHQSFFRDFNFSHLNYHTHFGTICHTLEKPFSSQEALGQHRQEVQRQYQALKELDNEYSGNKRNLAWKETIPRHMREHGFKKPIIMVGYAHVFPYYNPRVELTNLLQEVLPFSTLAIDALPPESRETLL